ncbi:MAG: hypothetical protein PHD46_07200 [Eubacteriales bacterium]|nr:hypothetical protein [Eubacteriales bacterium]
MEKTNETKNVETEEHTDMYYLKSGDIFTAEAVKILQSKLYANKIVKVLCSREEQSPEPVVFSSASKIVSILEEPWALGEQFEVVQCGTFKGFPVLTLQSMNKEIREKISRLLF